MNVPSPVDRSSHPGGTRENVIAREGKSSIEVHAQAKKSRCVPETQIDVMLFGPRLFNFWVPIDHAAKEQGGTGNAHAASGGIVSSRKVMEWPSIS
jgi:hypothetical protein